MNTTVSVASLASATAISSPSIAAEASVDPIFELIEAHKAAFTDYLQQLSLHFADEEDKTAEAASDEARAKKDDAAMALVDVAPTTLMGVSALLNYVEAFNRGSFKIDDMKSSVCEWPGGCLVDAETYSEEGAEGGEVGFAFAVLLNVRAALASAAA